MDLDDRIGLLGVNGAGKSTFAKLIAKALTVETGEFHRDGKMRVGWFHQHQIEAMDPTDTPLEIIRRAMPDASESSRRSRLAQFGLPFEKQETTVASLSGGERARTHLARALAQIWQPPADGAARWLLLDEPTAALDLAHQHHAMRLLRQWAGQQGAGVVAVIHDLNLALRYADDVLVLGGDAGVHHGAVLDVLQPALVRQVWGMQCDPVRSSDGALQYIFVADTTLPA
jgi:iron complex transport system ATP-binding protein